MSLKVLPSTLYLLVIIALLVDGAIAESDAARAIKAQLASDYDEAKFGFVMRDADELQNLHALDQQTATVAVQAYYFAGDYTGCVKYIREHFRYPNNPRGEFWVTQASIIQVLLERCQKS